MDTFLDKLIEAGQFFAFVFAELVVLFIGISFLVGVLNEFITPDKAQRWLSASKGRGYFIGAGLGALTPFCSCSTIPIMLGLLKAKAGFGPTMTFLIASPLLNPVIIILFVAAIGLEKTLLYMIMAISMAIGAGLILENSATLSMLTLKQFLEVAKPPVATRKHPLLRPRFNYSPPHLPWPRWKRRLFPWPKQPPAAVQAGPDQQICGSRNQTGGSVSSPNPWASSAHSFPYVLIGVVIGAIAHGFVPKDLVVKWAGPDNPLAVPVAAVIGVPLYIRASTMIPIAMSLVAKGLSLGAMMALVIEEPERPCRSLSY